MKLNTRFQMFASPIALATALSVTALLFLGCTKKTNLEYGLDIKETLRINLNVEPPSLDWLKSTDTTSATINNNIMDGLVDYDLRDPNLKLIPSLATEWTPTQNGKVWTFTIRKGVKWTDGVEFTAQHVLDAWNRLLKPETASEYAYFLFAIKNAQDYNAGKIKDFKEVGVKINDKGQIVVELERAMAFFPLLTGHHATYPIRLDVVEKHGDRWTEPGNIVTLGPYKLKIWDHDKALVMERNDDYWGEKAKIKYVLNYMINEYSTAVNLFEAGKLDFQETLPSKEISQLKKNPGFRLVPMLALYYYGFNARKPPFNDVRVRKAFVHAVDRKQITDLLAAGHAPLSGWIPVGVMGNDNERGLKFDPELAKKLLDEAGYKDRSKFPPVTIGFNTNENNQRTTENVQAQIKKNLGIEVQISNEEWKVYLNRLNADPPPMYRMSWLADYPDPDNFVNLMTSFSKNNYSGWGNKRYDDLVAEGSSALDPARRKAIYSEAQKILTETDVPVLPIYSQVEHILLSDRVVGMPITPLLRWRFNQVSFKQ